MTSTDHVHVLAQILYIFFFYKTMPNLAYNFKFGLKSENTFITNKNKEKEGCNEIFTVVTHF